MTKNLFALLAWAAILPFSRAADAPARCSLLVVECQPGKNVADPEVLVRYHFENGVLKKRELLATSANNNGPRYDLGGNFIHLNRFVITRWGDIFDLKSSTCLQQGQGLDLIACEGPGIIFFRSNDREFYRYDLEKQVLSKIGDPGKWSLLMKKQLLPHVPVLSPDGTKSATDVVFSRLPPVADAAPEAKRGTGNDAPMTRMEIGSGKIVLCTPDGKTKILASGFVSELSLRSSYFPETPIFWLDNDRILTQRSNGKLVIVKMDGSVDSVVDIPIKDQPLSPPQISRDPAGRILYTCVDTYVVNVEKKIFDPFEWRKFENDFEMEVIPLPAASKIRHSGVEIGFDSLDPASVRTFPGHLAAATAKINPQSIIGIRVWNSTSKAWTNLEPAGFLIDIIGWVEDAETAPAAR